ncbi:hypothetical protein Vadar_015076 [Vaccinium darrowii]|uniref:Uncharacterized protein n=1 Tax=Vaccinium darrowii TaxID=229202 RepID=A0ACB7XR06_9ERIC|nr:hypothetical protein Vadar_015076 [Vaccinium darrowii]
MLTLKETSNKLPLHSSYVISTSGPSPPYLLGESDGLDGNHNPVSTTYFCMSRVTEEPIQRLVKAVRSLSYKSSSASVSDIESIVRLVDSTVGSKPSNGSRSAIGEDFGGVANFIQQGEKLDRNSRKTNGIGVAQSNICASSCETDSFNKLTDPKKFDLSTGSSHNKRPRSVGSLLVLCSEATRAAAIPRIFCHHSGPDRLKKLLMSTCGTPETEGSQGTIVRCSFNTVTIFNADMTPKHVSVMPLLSPLLLLVPRNYPDCSPVILDKLPAEVRKALLRKENVELQVSLVTRCLSSSFVENLELQIYQSKLNVIMRNLLQTMSVGDIAKSWDFCARVVITEYAHQLNGGGNFSSTNGTWEDHLSTT